MSAIMACRAILSATPSRLFRRIHSETKSAPLIKVPRSATGKKISHKEKEHFHLCVFVGGGQKGEATAVQEAF